MNTTNIDTTHAGVKGISGSTLKIIAIISMIIDHIGAVILFRMLILRGMMDVTNTQLYTAFLESNAGLYYTYTASRLIGRIAFPIFCFLLVEGFLHTHNLKKYLSRLFLFALLSEIPYDIALTGKLFYWQYQNVFFTLLFGVLAITGIQFVKEKKEWHISLKVFFSTLVVGLCMATAFLFKSDYDLIGVLIIVVIYLLKQRKTLAVGIGCVPLMEVTSFFSLIPIYLYNGKRGINMKWFFYLFYPIHLLALYLIACLLGLGKIT